MSRAQINSISLRLKPLLLIGRLSISMLCFHCSLYFCFTFIRRSCSACALSQLSTQVSLECFKFCRCRENSDEHIPSASQAVEIAVKYLEQFSSGRSIHDWVRMRAVEAAWDCYRTHLSYARTQLWILGNLWRLPDGADLNLLVYVFLPFLGQTWLFGLNFIEEVVWFTFSSHSCVSQELCCSCSLLILVWLFQRESCRMTAKDLCARDACYLSALDLVKQEISHVACHTIHASAGGKGLLKTT